MCNNLIQLSIYVLKYSLLEKFSDFIFSDLLHGGLFSCLISLFQSVMDDRTFVLWRGQQRLNFNEDDVTAERISAVFRVSVASLFD